MAETTGTPAPVDNSPSLASFIGDQFGDYRDSEPDPVEEAPSTTASEPATPVESEGSAPPETVAEPATEPAGDAPDSAAQALVEPDPLEGSAPLAYVVNGESRTSDGITLLKDGGAIVDPDKVSWLQQRLSERDHLYERSQAQYRDLDAYNKLSTWTPDGATAPVSGRQGLEALHVSRAELLAEVTAFRQLMSDPNNIRNVISADEAGNLLWNKAGVENFQLRLDNAKARLGPAIQAWISKNVPIGQATVVQTDAPMSREQIVSSAPETVSAVLGALKITNLTAEDQADLAAILPDYVRPATAADVQHDPSLTVGRPFVDPKFAAFPKRLSAVRGDTAKVVAGSNKVDQANAARIAAAQVGSKVKTAPKIAPATEPKPSPNDNFDQAYDMREKAAAGMLRAHAFGGR